MSQYKVSVLVGGFTPPPGDKYPLGMVIFQDGYLSKELISTFKTNGWTIYQEQFETKLSIFSIFNILILQLNFRANKWETKCISLRWGTEQRQSMPTIFFLVLEFSNNSINRTSCDRTPLHHYFAKGFKSNLFVFKT